jgi:hypothetical protein
VSDTGVQVSDVLAIAAHVSDVSGIALHDSEVSGIALHANPMIVPTAPVAPFPIISIDVTFETVSTEPVPSTPVMAWNDMTSALTVPTAPVALFPVGIGEARIVPMDAVDALPVMATVLIKVTVPTLPVVNVPFSWIDLLESRVPMASVEALPEMTTLPMP